jgi:hypothetical protein
LGAGDFLTRGFFGFSLTSEDKSEPLSTEESGEVSEPDLAFLGFA